MSKTKFSKAEIDAAKEKLARKPEFDPDLEDENPQITYPPHEELIAQISELENQLLRTKADMENMRRRQERELAEAHKYSVGDIVRRLLEVVDNLERALSQKAEGEGVAALYTGVELTLKLLQGTLEKYGVKVIDPVGAPFNPDLHEAMTMQESTEHAPGTVLTVLQKGYQLHDRLLRPALVVVSKEQP